MGGFIINPHRHAASGGVSTDVHIAASNTDTHTSAAESWTYNLPAHQADDIIFIAICTQSNTVDSWSPSSGWTAHRYPTGHDAGPFTLAMQWIRATDSSTTDPTISAMHSSNTDPVKGVCFVVRNCTTSGDPFSQDESNGGFFDTNTASAINAAVTGGLVIAIGTKHLPTSHALTVSPPPAGWTTVIQYPDSWICFVLTYDTLTTNGVNTPADALYTFDSDATQNTQTFIAEPA